MKEKTKVKKKLKLTRLTVSNLERVKGGIDQCRCQLGAGDGAFNRDNPQISVRVCEIPD
ncbi:MAG: hypothetical protein GY940_42520 [bacterium]|nr:hypothetical protein [bacterium]